MAILEVRGLCKNYPQFSLRDVTFSLEEGYIMGFIGRNGAGKTTTLKSMLNLVHPDGGSVEIFNKPMAKEELAIKQELGVVLGGFSYYSRNKVSDIHNVVRRFYENWDDRLFASYLKAFSVDEGKRVKELSDGMRVKLSLAIALSHKARLLLLDEPTSGLDPVSRDEILEIFQYLIEKESCSILFSTHITSDLEKCADYITYIKNGSLFCSDDRESLLERYRLVRGKQEELTETLKEKLIGLRVHRLGFEGLIEARSLAGREGLSAEKATLEDIMIHLERGEENEEPAL